MKLKEFAKFMLLYSEQIRKPPIPKNKKTKGCLIFEEKTRASVEFKKIEDEILVDLRIGEEDYLNITLDEFEDLVQYRNELIIRKIIDLLKELSIKYYKVDIGMKETIKAIFYENIKKPDIEIVGEKIGIDDFIMDIRDYSVEYDEKEIKNHKNYNFVAKELLKNQRDM